MPECYQVEKILWDLRHDESVISRLASNPSETLKSYGLTQEEQDAMLRQDFRKLIELGVNPILLYFGALEMGIARNEYYKKLGDIQDIHNGGSNG